MPLIDKKNSISVFFPCYNDAGTIGLLVKDALDMLSARFADYEVIVIDDGSSDTSRAVLLKLAKKYPHLRLLFHPTNRGYGGALRSGFQAASKDLIFYTDGDGQYDIKELPILLSLMTQDADFINGIKMSRHDSTYRIIIGNLYSFVVRWLFWLPIYDVDCDYRLIRKKIISQIHLSSTSGAICIELVKKSHLAGAKFRQVSVHHYNRRFGSSQFFRLDRIFYTLRDVGGLWYHLMLHRLDSHP